MDEVGDNPNYNPLNPEQLEEVEGKKPMKVHSSMNIKSQNPFLTVSALLASWSANFPNGLSRGMRQLEASMVTGVQTL
ncbi:hypothetical protein TNIN_465791 [Trichonephila inaurata madagascariensis]|uniref:Uncharacterized protein n=1 Tax=Trichonephila inaurata madagascariensis TaxID=2747483 RepID=A0A8X6YWC3_9ARAC|nr:hypothetical protein TNIN_465791 [Trichonephila inaurata madagascariensis]